MPLPDFPPAERRPGKPIIYIEGPDAQILEALGITPETHDYPSSFVPPEGWIRHEVPGSKMVIWAPPGVDPFAKSESRLPDWAACFEDRRDPPQTCSGGVQRDAPPSLLDRLTEARITMHRQAHPGDKPAQAEQDTT